MAGWTRDYPWVPEGSPYGELTVEQRKRINCISRRHGVNLRAGLTFEEWLDLLPVQVASMLLEAAG
jgi:hypothetical protein